jgi:hypothetical protein
MQTLFCYLSCVRTRTHTHTHRLLIKFTYFSNVSYDTQFQDLQRVTATSEISGPAMLVLLKVRS